MLKYFKDMFQKIKTKLKNLDALDKMIIAIVIIVAIWKFVYGEVNFDWLDSNNKEESRKQEEDN